MGTGSDTRTESGEETDTETETQSEERVVVEQHTVEIEVINQTDSVKYLNNFSLGAFMEIDLLDGGAWQPWITFAPPCTAPCESIDKGEACCIPDECFGRIPDLFVLHPNDWVKYYWSGHLYESEEGYCSDCACHWDRPVMSGTYRARVCAYESIECDNPADCEEAPPTGVFVGGAVSGDRICYAETFEIFYEDDYLLIIISEETMVIMV